uniref:Uncharacterized protein n=1 Tax=Chromera velia CCMP2878 TaxID=1169474 RepID=A0A0G4IAQ2_9ALVE|eukprot:Cvel_12516.t1-p1 / transcript=Cvel_12516.t1 / gene=Cvel_12516 / organism=Chromera_velia_CCMP2878 / gene_product=hypothetical protein / transcript_product=hypothetical protein / location=Cvel_scaffold821:49374-54345(+) / protein_length=189 / sequence_SO=supercontig / SO=protein_coding / is_pseudo=false
MKFLQALAVAASAAVCSAVSSRTGFLAPASQRSLRSLQERSSSTDLNANLLEKASETFEKLKSGSALSSGGDQGSLLEKAGEAFDRFLMWPLTPEDIYPPPPEEREDPLMAYMNARAKEFEYRSVKKDIWDLGIKKELWLTEDLLMRMFPEDYEKGQNKNFIDEIVEVFISKLTGKSEEFIDDADEDLE